VSGDVDVADPCDVVDARTASGDVSVDRVSTTLQVSLRPPGDVECPRHRGHDRRHERVGRRRTSWLDQPGQVTVKTVSGDIQVRVARGLVVDVDANTVSGELSHQHRPRRDWRARASDEEPVYVKAATVSGDIRIDKAW
jgi:DUF4097 and DUF4098 domain-containing protein YvlB